MKERLTVFNKAQPDREHSTYRHEIYIIGKASPLVGYSKKAGLSEKENKLQLLKDIVLRLILNKNNYLDQSYAITFYKSDLYGRNDEREVLTVTKTGWQLKHDYENNYDLNKFLTELYEAMKKGDKITLHKMDKNPAKGANYFDFSLHFDTEKDLKEYCVKLEKVYGFASGRCLGYYHKMLELKKVG
ncbi:MAG: hypothetical protein U0V72_00580 [Cytophagales bacterium]